MAGMLARLEITPKARTHQFLRLLFSLTRVLSFLSEKDDGECPVLWRWRVFVQLGKKSNALLLILKFCLENSWRTNKRPLTQLPVVCQSRSDTCLIAVSMLDLVCVLGLFILGIGFFFAWNSSIEFVMSEPFFFSSPRPPVRSKFSLEI